jgi:AraC-like DNA-binding protein
MIFCLSTNQTMAIELTLAHDERLDLQNGLPPDYRGPILRGAVALYTKTNLAELVLQEIAGENYSIRFIVGKLLKRLYARGWIHTLGLYSYFMLKNGTRKTFDSIGKLHLRQDQYACFYTESSNCSAMFEKNNEFRALDFFYSPKLLEELFPFFPELRTITLTLPGTILTGKARWALPPMKEITNQILNCPFDEATCQFYFDLKVRELLFQILENIYKKEPNEKFFTPWETARIHEARTILGTYISKKPPSVKSLAKQVALNELKLKNGFRQFFNTGIFEWLWDQRMQHARHLVLTTNTPIKEISSMVGYPLTTNFITAFRRRFGVTPGSLRRK